MFKSRQPSSGATSPFSSRRPVAEMTVLSRDPKKLMEQLGEFRLLSENPDHQKIIDLLKTNVFAAMRARVSVSRGGIRESSIEKKEDVDILVVCIKEKDSFQQVLIFNRNPQSLTDYHYFHEHLNVDGAFQIKGTGMDVFFVKPSNMAEVRALKDESTDTGNLVTLRPPPRMEEQKVVVPKSFIDGWKEEAMTLNVSETAAELRGLYDNLKRDEFEFRRSIAIEAQRKNGNQFWMQAGDVLVECTRAADEMRTWLDKKASLLANQPAIRETLERLISAKMFYGSCRRYVKDVGYAVSLRGKNPYNRNYCMVNRNTAGWNVFAIAEGLEHRISCVNTSDAIRYISHNLDKVPMEASEMIVPYLQTDLFGDKTGRSLKRLTVAASRCSLNICFDLGSGPLAFYENEERMVVLNTPVREAGGNCCNAVPDVICNGGRLIMLSTGAAMSLPDLEDILPLLPDDPVVSGELMAQKILQNRIEGTVPQLDSTIILSYS